MTFDSFVPGWHLEAYVGFTILRQGDILQRLGNNLHFRGWVTIYGFCLTSFQLFFSRCYLTVKGLLHKPTCLGVYVTMFQCYFLSWRWALNNSTCLCDVGPFGQPVFIPWDSSFNYNDWVWLSQCGDWSLCYDQVISNVPQCINVTIYYRQLGISCLDG